MRRTSRRQIQNKLKAAPFVAALLVCFNTLIVFLTCNHQTVFADSEVTGDSEYSSHVFYINYRDPTAFPFPSTNIFRQTITGSGDTKTYLGPNGSGFNYITRNSFADMTYIENEAPGNLFLPTIFATNPGALDAATKRSFIVYTNVSTSPSGSGPFVITNPYSHLENPNQPAELWGVSSVYIPATGEPYFFGVAQQTTGEGNGTIDRFDLSVQGLPRYTSTLRNLSSSRPVDVALIPALGSREELVTYTNEIGQWWIGPSNTLGNAAYDVQISIPESSGTSRLYGVTYAPRNDSLYVIFYNDNGDNLPGSIYQTSIANALAGGSASVFTQVNYVPWDIDYIEYDGFQGLDVTYETATLAETSQGRIDRYRLDSPLVIHSFLDGDTSGFSEAGLRGPLAVAGTPLFGGQSLVCNSPCFPLGEAVPELPSANFAALFGMLMTGLVLKLRKKAQH